MSDQPNQIEVRSVEDQKQDRTVIIVNRPVGFFGKAIVLIAAFLVLALAFIFSLIVFVILAATVAVLLVYAWWATRRARRTMQDARRQ